MFADNFSRAELRGLLKSCRYLSCFRRNILTLNISCKAAVSAPPPSRQRSSSLRTTTQQSPPGQLQGGDRRRSNIGVPKQGQSAKQGGLIQNRKLTKRQKERAESEQPQRLAKVIAQAGFASRRKAEDLVFSGAVKVNDKRIIVPQHLVLPSIDKVTVKGKLVPQAGKKYYFALNKPKGYLCANSSSNREAGQQRLVVDLFQPWLQDVWKASQQNSAAVPPRLFTVGRLDVQTTGLVFVTNDGEWAQTVQHPANNLTKEYIVTLRQPPAAKQLEEVAAGCVVDGAFVQPKSLAFAAANRKDKLRVVVGEGRNREVRVLMENAGLSVNALKRVRIGGFRLPRDLSIGEFRELKPYVAKRVIDRSVEMNPQTNPVLNLT